MTAPVYADGAATEIERLAAELASFRAFLTERGCGGVGDANGMHDLAQHHEELIADNERQAARISRLEAALLAAAEQFARYADYHLAKVPPDREKAATNVEWAARCREVVRVAAAALADATGEKA